MAYKFYTGIVPKNEMMYRMNHCYSAFQAWIDTQEADTFVNPPKSFELEGHKYEITSMFNFDVEEDEIGTTYCSENIGGYYYYVRVVIKKTENGTYRFKFGENGTRDI